MYINLQNYLVLITQLSFQAVKGGNREPSLQQLLRRKYNDVSSDTERM